MQVPSYRFSLSDIDVLTSEFTITCSHLVSKIADYLRSHCENRNSVLYNSQTKFHENFKSSQILLTDWFKQSTAITFLAVSPIARVIRSVDSISYFSPEGGEGGTRAVVALLVKRARK